MNTQVKVMLVDDSTVIRAALRKTLEREEKIKIVSSVGNGELGVQQAKSRQPDIVILDVEMPVMDGLTALPKILEVSPKTKVIMFSTLTAKGANISLKAFTLGAVECLVKPSSQTGNGDVQSFQDRLIELIKTLYPEPFLEPAAPPAKTMAKSSIAAKPSVFPPVSNDYTLNKDPMAYQGRPDLLAIGSSTGGPNALFEVCSHLQGINVPIVITQHMPPTFTKILAQHIQDKTGITAHEGQDGMRLENNTIYVAPGGYHMLLKRDGVNTVLKLDDGEPVNFCKPAVDPMFKSAVDIYGSKILGLILTGMGNDGQVGGEAIANAHGRIIAQDKETSTVWGMPRAVALAGVCSEVLPLNDIGPWLKRQFI